MGNFHDPRPLAALEKAGAFAGHEVLKTYLAVVRGNPPASGEIDHPLTRQRDDYEFQGERSSQEAQPALTRYRTLASNARAALLELEPVTGRSHQLRVHMAFIGHPILGDDLYAPLPPRAPRLLLHLSPSHPDFPGTREEQLRWAAEAWLARRVTRCVVPAPRSNSCPAPSASPAPLRAARPGRRGSPVCGSKRDRHDGWPNCVGRLNNG